MIKVKHNPCKNHELGINRSNIFFGWVGVIYRGDARFCVNCGHFTFKGKKYTDSKERVVNALRMASRGELDLLSPYGSIEFVIDGVPYNQKYFKIN